MNKNFTKCQKVSKYYVQYCLKIFVLLSTVKLMIRVSGNVPIFAQGSIFSPKSTMTKTESFPVKFFDQNVT